MVSVVVRKEKPLRLVMRELVMAPAAVAVCRHLAELAHPE
jgi:hypothetical protein